MMKSKLLAVFAVAIAVLVPASPTPAAAAPPSTDQAIVLRSAGNNGFGQFSNTDPSGCVRTEFGLSAGDFVSQQPPGAPNKYTQVVISLLQGDQCVQTGRQVFGAGELDKNALKVSNSGQSARLQSRITITDIFTGGRFDFDVDLTWSQASPRSGSHDTVHFELAPGCKFTAHVSGSTRPANVSGTVSGAGITNLTPEPGEGFIGSSNVGQVTIGGDACPPPGPE